MIDLITRIATDVDVNQLPHVSTGSDQITTVLNIVFNIIGALSVLMITIGGFRYVIANGDSNQISKAKNTILYALIGLAIAIFARTILAFVVGRL